MSKPTSDRDPWELVAESFLARYRTGERPSIEEYATRHPELADQIRRLMPALVILSGFNPTSERSRKRISPSSGR